MFESQYSVYSGFRLLTPSAERGLKDGHVGMGFVNQGYTNFYEEVVGIVVDPAVDNSDNLFVRPRPLALPKKKQRTTKLKAELGSSRRSRKKAITQQHWKEINLFVIVSWPLRRCR